MNFEPIFNFVELEKKLNKKNGMEKNKFLKIRKREKRKNGFDK